MSIDLVRPYTTEEAVMDPTGHRLHLLKFINHTRLYLALYPLIWSGRQSLASGPDCWAPRRWWRTRRGAVQYRRAAGPPPHLAPVRQYWRSWHASSAAATWLAARPVAD